jgi:Zn-dependent protease
MTGILELFAFIFILIFSVVIHEVAHGSAANALGDPTAKYAGRLTLNPVRHFDLFGSLIFPVFTFLVSQGAAVFGWAKPVPINPNNFRDQRYGSAKVALAGAGANVAVALAFGLALRFLLGLGIVSGMASTFYDMFTYIVVINLVLATFNLIPIPPLDGSHVLFAILPPSQEDFKIFLQQYGWMILVFLIFFPIGNFSFFNSLFKLVIFFYQIIVGAPLL